MKLLIISCSKRKQENKGLLPAFERYDGQVYRSLKKMKRENKYPTDLDIIIISAKYGLICPDKKIEYYDQLMDAENAKKYHDVTLNNLETLCNKKRYNSVCINLGKNYLMAIEGFNHNNIYQCHGRNGVRLHDMIEWIKAS